MSIKYVYLFLFFLIITYSNAQHVHIESSDNHPLHLNGGTPLINSFFEGNVFRGYFGSFLADPEDVDFGSFSALSKLHLTTQGTPRLTVAGNGNVGIGTISPTHRLTIQSGNIDLLNTDKGVMLNATDRPLITRGWGPFTSGIYSGIGRWGIFMEPNRLVFGIPDVANRAFEFSAYDSDSTRDTLLTIDKEGRVQRPATNTVDLLPFAMGNVRWDGVIQEGTENFSVTRLGIGQWTITLTGESYDPANFIVTATVSEISITPSFISTYLKNNPNRIGVNINSSNASFIDQNFHFIVYKLN